MIEAAMTKTKFAICVCNNHNYLPDTFFWTYLRLMKPANSHAIKGSASTKCGSLNEATAKALDWGAEWLFFMDVDMTFPIDAIKRLMSHGKQLVSGLYHVGNPPYAPVAGWVALDATHPTGYKFVNQMGDGWRFHYARFPDGLVEVDWVGAGCLLVRRDVFTAIGWPAWKDLWLDDQGQRIMGHDVNLCLRAKAAGIPLFVDADVNCGHLRYQEVERNFVDAVYGSDFWPKALDGYKARAKEYPYWDEIWLKEHMLSAPRASFYKDEHDYILNLIPSCSKIVDFGCGPGEFLVKARDARGCSGMGIDFSAEALERVAKAGFDVSKDRKSVV